MARIDLGRRLGRSPVHRQAGPVGLVQPPQHARCSLSREDSSGGKRTVVRKNDSSVVPPTHCVPLPPPVRSMMHALEATAQLITSQLERGFRFLE